MFRPLHHPIFWSFDMSAWTKVVGLGTSSNFCIWSLKSLGAKIGEKLLWIVVQNSKGQIEKKQLSSSWIPVTYLISSMVSFSLSALDVSSLSAAVWGGAWWPAWRDATAWWPVLRKEGHIAAASQRGAPREAWIWAEELIEAHRKCWDMGSEKQKISTHNQELVLL